MLQNHIPSIWTGMYPELPLPQALETLAEQGWRSFEISTEHLCEIDTADKSDRLLDKALDICVNRDLITLQGHASITANVADPDSDQRDNDMKQLKRHMDIASWLGVRNLVIHPGCYGGATSLTEHKRMLQYNVKAFRELGNYAAQLNMRIGLENMPHRIYASSASLMELVTAIDHEAVGVTLDTSHANITPGLELPAMIRDFGKKLICTHLSDNNGKDDQHYTPGSGTIDWRHVMLALDEIGYDGVINLEIPGECHPIHKLRALKSVHARHVAKMLIELPE